MPLSRLKRYSIFVVDKYLEEIEQHNDALMGWARMVRGLTNYFYYGRPWPVRVDSKSKFYMTERELKYSMIQPVFRVDYDKTYDSKLYLAVGGKDAFLTDISPALLQMEYVYIIDEYNREMFVNSFDLFDPKLVPFRMSNIDIIAMPDVVFVPKEGSTDPTDLFIRLDNPERQEEFRCKGDILYILEGLG